MQIVGYEPARGDGHALLLVSGADGVTSVDLEPGAELAYTLGERHCAGTVRDGEHVVCDASGAPYCSDHSDTWVCARCTGTCLKDEMDCFDDHAVYLAAFAPNAFKVGVTKEWRLETRLREQGADRAAHLYTVHNGRVARELEQELAADVGQFVRVSTKLGGLGDAVDEDAWRAHLDSVDPLAAFDLDYGLDLAERPLVETVATGTVRGTKGRVLVLDRGGTTYAVDMRTLVGHEVTAERTDRELQTSLGAF